MNTNLVNILKRIITEEGEAILGDPARLKGYVADYAAAESKAERLAFGRCIEYGAYNELKNAVDKQLAKAAIARRVNANEGLDLTLCNGALDVLEAALYGRVSGQQPARYGSPPSTPQYQPASPQARYMPPPAYQGQTQYQVPQSQVPQHQQSVYHVYQQPVYQQYQVPQGPGVRTGGLWVAVLVCNILGLNWISRFITGHVGTGILILLLDIITLATLAIGVGIILGIVGLIIWIVDLVKIGTKKWQMADGTYLAP
jgi:hypothetical protein